MTGHFTGSCAAHAVCHNTKPKTGPDNKGIFVVGSPQAYIRISEISYPIGHLLTKANGSKQSCRADLRIRSRLD
jgi:hypothetical protein